MKMLIDEVELTIYYENGDVENIPLSTMQTAIVIKILGLTKQKNGNVACFSDESLEKMVEMKGNPLKLKITN